MLRAWLGYRCVLTLVTLPVFLSACGSSGGANTNGQTSVAGQGGSSSIGKETEGVDRAGSLGYSGSGPGIGGQGSGGSDSSTAGNAGVTGDSSASGSTGTAGSAGADGGPDRCRPNSVGSGFDRLASQRALVLDTPLNRVQWLGAHNAWNDSNAIWANQRWGTERLLDGGIRSFDLDLHRNSSGDVRLCHEDCSAIYGAEDDYGAELAKYADWLEKNPCEILFIDLEDRVNDEEDVVGPLREHFGDALYAPDDKPSDRWETPREMIVRGKRVIVKSANVVYKDGPIWDGKLFASNAPPGYNYQQVKNFGIDGCTVSGKPLSADRLYGVYDSKLGKGLLIDNLVDDTGTIDAGNIPKLLKCGLNFVDVDRWDDGMLAAAVWSWGSAEPNGGTEENCAELAGAGRWNDVACDKERSFACESMEDPSTFFVTKTQGVWADGQRVCEQEFPGSRFSVPQTALHNAQVFADSGDERVWLNFSDQKSEGIWER